MNYFNIISNDLLRYIIYFINFNDFFNFKFTFKRVFNYINDNQYNFLLRLIYNKYYYLQDSNNSYNFQRIRNLNNADGLCTKTVSITKSKNINNLYNAMFCSKLFFVEKKQKTKTKN